MASPPQPDASQPSSGYRVFQAPEAPSLNLRTFLAYVDALHQWDYDAIMACFDEELEHRILPASLGRPVRNKMQYEEHFKGVIPMFEKFRVTIHDVIESDDKIAVHASSKGESTLGTPYTNEYTLMITFTSPSRGSPDVHVEELPKMRCVKEFVDSAFSAKFFSEEQDKMNAIAARVQETK
ncbi:hypothetical protein NLJ89_g9882 [Agrocybe chaxingu]|uniref:SnoaL-like domain-containing protein n=1 Tax=Agrocybe chaxingu TaxID=84603 RepID=A0A9W8MQT2_9AGAR|nr:hypothetical protein NLJ89_g9882 [Agrocybe chaxingu]